MVLALALAIGLASSARAQAGNPADLSQAALSQYKIDRWQTEQGLPMNTVQSVYQTRDGALWVGTGGGLARFDGMRFVAVESSPVPELVARPVFGFLQDAEGRLWIGHSRGAAVYRQGRFEVGFGVELTAGRRVWAFAQAADGAVWAATENGLVRWHDGATRVYREADGLPTNRLRALAFDTEGRLWIGTTGGGLVSLVDGRFTVLKPEQGFPHLEVRHLLADPAGGMWAATAGAGLVHVQQGVIRSYTVADGLPTDHLTVLAHDATGSLWIGTWGSGVSRLKDGRFSTINVAGGLEGDHIWSLRVDREGSLWVGTWHGGLNRLSRRAFVVFGKPEGLASDNVRSVLHTRDGVTWVAMAGGGINRFERGQMTAITRRDGLPSDETSALYEDADGSIWVASYTGGVARLRQGRIETWGTAQGLPNADVRALYRDRRGTLWAGTQSGLARFDGRLFVPVREPGAPLDGVVAIVEDRSGSLWFGTTGSGLVRLRDGRFDALTRDQGLASNWIIALHEDAAGSLWIGTNGEGLNRLRDGRISTIRPANGLWDGLVQVILEDRTGHFWITCNRGFFRVPREDLDAFAEGRISQVRSTGYGPGDALRASTFAGGLQQAGAIDAAGLLWLPSVKGLVIVDPARLPDTGAPPTVSVDEVSVNGVEGPPPAAVVLPPGTAPLSIRYSAGTLLNADRVHFRYRMEGLTPGWVDAGKSREATFAGLPPGSYQFRLAATIDGRRWQEADVSLPITVQPHIHQTLWFRVLAVIAALSAGAGVYRLRTHQLRRRHAEMQRLVAAQTEELRLANEHLSRLSFADALTGLANRRRLDEVLDAEWRRAARQHAPLAIVMADIDAFKSYNDTLGHPVADKCLADVAEVIRQTANRAGDFAARYGGEEFVVLIPGADLAAATAFAERLRLACEVRAIPHPSSPVAPVVTLSLGVASHVPAPDASPITLLAEADAALYRAKQDGRNRVAS
jgi:diguanylate cyclase (GGDEF)-like protein